MAKSKKSKILASMLAVSTMAVFYAAPVMAGTASVINTDDGIAISIESTGTITGGGQPNDGIYFDRAYDNNAGAVYGMLTISSEKIAEALKGQDVTFGAVTADTISNTKDSFIVDSDGNVIATSVATSGDVLAGTYSLKTVGADLDTVEQRTQKITYVQSADTTNISGKVIASGVTLNNGNISTNGALVAKEVANISGDTLSGVAGDVDDLTLSVSGVKKMLQN